MIVIASDHGGYALKQELMAHLKEKGVEFEDIGTYSETSCNYPEYAERAARGALLSDCFSAEMCRAHNNANMCALGGRVTGPELAKRMVDLFLTTEFLGGRHAARVDMITALENHDH